MTLQDLNPGELLRYITACRELIAGYKGETDPVCSCPICVIANDIGEQEKLDNNCNACLWVMMDNKECVTFKLRRQIGVTFEISAVRQDPTRYPTDVLRCIARLERWIVALDAELATRG